MLLIIRHQLRVEEELVSLYEQRTAATNKINIPSLNSIRDKVVEIRERDKKEKIDFKQ